jgi:hypothetical protein
MTNEVTFLPCPFCGSQPVTHSYAAGGKTFAWVRCEVCHIDKTLNTDNVDSNDGSVKYRRFVIEAVAHWWNGRHTVEPSAEGLPKDYAEVILRVEIVSDTLHKVNEFAKSLADVILEAPSDFGANVMVTIHRDGELSVFETNRSALKSSSEGA